MFPLFQHFDLCAAVRHHQESCSEHEECWGAGSVEKCQESQFNNSVSSNFPMAYLISAFERGWYMCSFSGWRTERHLTFLVNQTVETISGLIFVDYLVLLHVYVRIGLLLFFLSYICFLFQDEVLVFSPGPIRAEDGDRGINTPLIYSILSGKSWTSLSPWRRPCFTTTLQVVMCYTWSVMDLLLQLIHFNVNTLRLVDFAVECFVCYSTV